MKNSYFVKIWSPSVKTLLPWVTKRQKSGAFQSWVKSDLLPTISRVKWLVGEMFPFCHISGKEPRENICRGAAKPGRWTFCQSHSNAPIRLVADSLASSAPTGRARSDVSSWRPPCGELLWSFTFRASKLQHPYFNSCRPHGTLLVQVIFVAASDQALH